jgi:pimeloyl-ACP methyl ester carboxylesterase
MKKLKYLCLFILTNLLLVGGTVFIWSSIPLKVDASLPDPAVDYVNKTYKSSYPFKEAYVEYKGNQLHYVEAGEGDVVLFLHGFPSYWLSHVRQLESIRSAYKVIAIDGLGAGRSSAPNEVNDYQLEHMAEHVIHLLDGIGVTKVHLVGHDWGAAFAFGFAQRFPERVNTVTGISVPPQNVMVSLLETSESQRQVSGYIERLKGANLPLLFAFGATSRIYDGAYAPMVESNKLTAAEGKLFKEATGVTKRINAHINWYRANLPAADEIDSDSFWPGREVKLTVPSLFIWGTDDPIVSKDTVTAFKAVADDLILLPLDDVGHWPQVNKHEEVTQAILTHLKNNPI